MLPRFFLSNANSFNGLYRIMENLGNDTGQSLFLEGDCYNQIKPGIKYWPKIDSLGTPFPRSYAVVYYKEITSLLAICAAIPINVKELKARRKLNDNQKEFLLSFLEWGIKEFIK